MKKNQNISNIHNETELINDGDESVCEVLPSRVNKHRIVAVAVVALILVVSVVLLFVGRGLSWFSPKPKADLTVKSTEHTTETLYWNSTSSSYVALDDDINISIGKLSSLKLRIQYNGLSSAYIRVRLFESFKKGTTANGTTTYASYPSTDVTYTLSNKWVKKGEYYYYTDIVKYTERIETGPNNTDVTYKDPTLIDFVTKASSSNNSTNAANVYMNLVSVVETVQPDRFQEFFGFDPAELTA